MGSGLNWKHIAACAAGTSHTVTNAPCQDSAFATCYSAPDNAEYLVIFVADGAGSAVHGGDGADLTCEVGARFFWELIQSGSTDVCSPASAQGVLEAIRAAIESKAHEELKSMRDYACTLVGCVVGPSKALAFQVGDGVLVFREDDSLVPVFWPETGEYANMTYFVTDESASEHFQIDVRPSPTEVSAMTDGLQRLALIFATKEVHPGFFDPMFQVLRGTPSVDCDTLSEQLFTYLNSDSINSRTDDDKTLVMATRFTGFKDEQITV